MNSNSELAARAARLSQRRSAEERAPAVRAPRVRPVRVTTDLPPQTYRFLLSFAAALAEETEQARVPHSDIIRALLAELETDAVLRAAVAARVQ